MALVLNEKYGFEKRGFKRFWIARSTRLLPTYWFGCLLSIALILLLTPDVTSAFNHKLTWPDTPWAIFANITMVGLFHPSSDIGLIPARLPTLVPPAWALTIELFFYLCLSVYFGKTLKRGLALLALGFVYAFSVLGLS